MKQTLKAVLFIAVLALSACNNREIKPAAVKEIEGFDYGRVRNNIYSNTFFNIKMDVPKGWEVQDDAQKKELMERGSEVYKDDEKMKAAVKASEITTANLFTAFARKPGTVAFNHNLILLAENVGSLPFDITAEAYLANANKIIRSSKMDIVQIDNSFTKKTLNGMDFYQMDLILYSQKMQIHQTYLMTIEKDFAFGFIYSYLDDAQKAELEKAINTIRPYKK